MAEMTYELRVAIVKGIVADYAKAVADNRKIDHEALAAVLTDIAAELRK